MFNKQVLKAFVHGDEDLLKNYPELQEALVWVYFHSNVPEFNKVECWGPLKDASSNVAHNGNNKKVSPISNWEWPERCVEDCNCCFPPMTSIPWSQKVPKGHEITYGPHNQIGQQQ